MNKKQCIIFLLLFISTNAFTLPDSPMDNWHYTEFYTLNGTTFNTLTKNEDFGTGKTLADSYREQSGYAVVNGVSVQLWLYDTITYHNGNASKIYDKYIPNWLEDKGYVIDYDKIRVINPDSGIPNSIKMLMQQRRCDTAVLFVNYYSYSNPANCIIYEYLNSKKVYKTTHYPLIRR